MDELQHFCDHDTLPSLVAWRGFPKFGWQLMGTLA
jgi:hypothetical protein